jgi:hypothetical protein
MQKIAKSAKVACHALPYELRSARACEAGTSKQLLSAPKISPPRGELGAQGRRAKRRLGWSDF